MRPTTCPYCGSDCFVESVRADKANARAPERFSQVVGHWYNRCAGCDGWSLFKDGKQESVADRASRPRAHSLAAIE